MDTREDTTWRGRLDLGVVDERSHRQATRTVREEQLLLRQSNQALSKPPSPTPKTPLCMISRFPSKHTILRIRDIRPAAMRYRHGKVRTPRPLPTNQDIKYDRLIAIEMVTLLTLIIELLSKDYNTVRIRSLLVIFHTPYVSSLCKLLIIH